MIDISLLYSVCIDLGLPPLFILNQLLTTICFDVASISRLLNTLDDDNNVE